MYMLECNDCEAIYIGQTGRSFKIRYSEHMRSLRQLQVSITPFDSTSSFADHLINGNHSPSSNNPQPLHFAPKGPKLDILESIEIKKAILKNLTILNNQQDIKSSTIIDLLFKWVHFQNNPSLIVLFFQHSSHSLSKNKNLKYLRLNLYI